MPNIDLPLEELKEYRGCNPKPHDFDLFWKREISNLDPHKTNTKIKPAAFQVPFADCSDLFFTGTGSGSPQIHCKYIKPKGDLKPHPAVLIFHGYTGQSPHWSELLKFVAAGYSVFAMDCRGQGGLSEDKNYTGGTTWRGQIIRGLSDGPDNLLFKHIYLDTVLLARIAFQQKEVDENRVGCLGLSQGGALTLACAALEPKIKLAAPLYPFLCDFKRVWQIDLGEGAYEELSYYFRKFDPTHEKEEEIFTTLGYLDLQFHSPNIKAEVLLGTGLMDKVCPPSGQFAMYNNIQSQKNMIIYPDFGHEMIPHFHDKTYQFMLNL